MRARRARRRTLRGEEASFCAGRRRGRGADRPGEAVLLPAATASSTAEAGRHTVEHVLQVPWHAERRDAGPLRTPAATLREPQGPPPKALAESATPEGGEEAQRPISAASRPVSGHTESPDNSSARTMRVRQARLRPSDDHHVGVRARRVPRGGARSPRGTPRRAPSRDRAPRPSTRKDQGARAGAPARAPTVPRRERRAQRRPGGQGTGRSCPRVQGPTGALDVRGGIRIWRIRAAGRGDLMVEGERQRAGSGPGLWWKDQRLGPCNRL